MKSKLVAALVASAALLWGPAHAASDLADPQAQDPGVIILELQPGAEGASEQDQAMLGMLLLQLLSAMQAEGDNVEVQPVAPPVGERI